MMTTSSIDRESSSATYASACAAHHLVALACDADCASAFWTPRSGLLAKIGPSQSFRSIVRSFSGCTGRAFIG